MITLATPVFLGCSETYSSFEKETANENLKNSHIFFFSRQIKPWMYQFNDSQMPAQNLGKVHEEKLHCW